jgi:hypothetical protein
MSEGEHGEREQLERVKREVEPLLTNAAAELANGIETFLATLARVERTVDEINGVIA